MGQEVASKVFSRDDRQRYRQKVRFVPLIGEEGIISADIDASEARASRHQFGDAADIIIDDNKDGRMDDLNRDGRVDVADADVIQRAVWMYLRFTLSYRDVEDLLADVRAGLERATYTRTSRSRSRSSRS